MPHGPHLHSFIIYWTSQSHLRQQGLVLQVITCGAILEPPINLQWVLLDCRGKPELQEETSISTGRNTNSTQKRGLNPGPCWFQVTVIITTPLCCPYFIHFTPNHIFFLCFELSVYVRTLYQLLTLMFFVCYSVLGEWLCMYVYEEAIVLVSLV